MYIPLSEKHAAAGGRGGIRPVAQPRWATRLARAGDHLRGSPPPPTPPTVHSASGNAALQLAGGRRIAVGDDIMIGCAPLDSQGQATPTVHALLAAGVKHFDSAPLYGTSEERLGDALASAPAELSRGVSVHTKCGLDTGESGGTDFSAGSVRQQFARSLARFHLRPDGTGQPYRLRTLRVHHPALVGDDIPPGGALAEIIHPTGGAVAVMLGLRDEGAIQHVSMGMNTTDQHNGVGPTVSLLAAVPPGTFDSALLAYPFQMTFRP